MNEPAIDIRGVHHTYRHHAVAEPVLHGIDLCVPRGEFLVVMGPSGCGKTTLLNVLGLMMPPSRADRLRVAGADATGLSDPQRARLRRETIGFVFQRFNLLPTISARQNVALPLSIRGAAVDGQLDALIDRVGLRDMQHKKPGQLSVGQQQRFALARALVGRPAILLADEPTGNLDSANAGAILDLLAEFHHDRNLTVIMITHNEHLTDRADRVLYMRDGRLSDKS